MYTSEIINILGTSNNSIGTGFFASSEYIITCTHVLAKAGCAMCGQSINYKYEDCPTIYTASLVFCEEGQDWAILHAEHSRGKYIPLCDRIDTDLFVDCFGYPNGSHIKIKSTAKVESSIDNIIQLSNANSITTGFSGAPIIHNNAAIGIINRIANPDQYGRLVEVAFAIPSKCVIDLSPRGFIKKKEVCIGFGKKNKRCSNYVVYSRSGLCQECHEAQFNEEVKAIYKAQKYVLYDCDGFFIAELTYGAIKYYHAICTIVRHNNTISLQDLFHVHQKISTCNHNVSLTVLITNTSTEDEGKSYANGHNIIIMTKDELLHQLFDFESYREDLIKYVNSEPLASHYLDVYGTKELISNNKIKAKNTLQYNLGYDEQMAKPISVPKAPLNKYVDSFLVSKHKALLILGDYGSGKTSFCYKYALDLLNKYLEGKSHYFPLLIKLKGYNKAVGVNQLLTDYFVNVLGVNNFSIASLKLFLKNISTVIIFDGYDEVAKKVDFDIKYDVLKDICNLALDGTKIVITCRPNYFQNASEFEDIFKRSHLQYEPGEKPKIEFIENSIAELTPYQINQYIDSYQSHLNKLGISKTELIGAIAKIHDLTDLSKRPFLLYMILRTLPELIKNEKLNDTLEINASMLYSTYTKNWLIREDRKNKTLIKQLDKEVFCKELAFELYVSNSISLSYKELPRAIKKHFKHIEHIEDIDYFSHDIQSCSFLTSDRTGEFKFIHKSFMEYFVADRVVDKLESCSENQKKNLNTINRINTILGSTHFSMEICYFIVDLCATRKLDIFKNADRYFSNVNPVAKSNILSIISKTCVNIAEFLSHYRVFENDTASVDFSGAKFENGIITNLSFCSSHFYSADFIEVQFINCDFSGAVFNESTLTNVTFINCRFTSTNWRESKLTNCKFHMQDFDDLFNVFDNEIDNEFEIEGEIDSHTLSTNDFSDQFSHIANYCSFADSSWCMSSIISCSFFGYCFWDNTFSGIIIHNTEFISIDFSGTTILDPYDFKNLKLFDVSGEPYEF